MSHKRNYGGYSPMEPPENDTIELAKPITAVAIRAANAASVRKRDIPKGAARDSGLPQALTHEEARALIAAGLTPRDRLLMETMYRTGARATEIAFLRRCDIKAEGIELMNLKQRQARRRRKLVYVDDPALCGRLLLWCQQQGIGDAGYVFPSRKGGALGRDQVRRIIHGASERAGVYLSKGGERTAVWSHVLRHSAAVRWLEGSGGDIEFTAEQMGHSRLASMDAYRAIADERRRAIARQCQF